MSVTVSAFYKFVAIENREALADELRALLQSGNIKGSLLIASEGINATISGEDAAMHRVLAHLRADPRFSDLISKESIAPRHPFGRLKVRLKKEIVTLGRPEADPARQVGIYVKPQDWNALISENDVVVLDTRNTYEVAAGTFQGALDPHTRSFREFPGYVSAHLDPERTPRVAMFCTGGIRCEKASAYMLAHGFKEVYHLEGGILKYLETVPADESLWRGECFVFDERVTLTYGVKPGRHRMCKACGHPVDAGAADAREALNCPGCGAAL